VWANYKHLQLRWIAKTSRSAPNDSFLVQVNGDTGSNYLRQEVEWDHTNGTFYPLSGTTTCMVGGAAANTYANYFGSGYVNIYDINSATKNGVIYPSLDPSIFEVKFPNRDIKGRVVNQ